MTASFDHVAGLRPGWGLAAAALALLTFAAGPAPAHPLYDTGRILPRQGNACVGAQQCRVIAAEPRRIEAGRGATIAAGCPEARPYLVNWEAAYHEHIELRQLKRQPRRVSVVAHNLADAPGRVTLFIGCARERPGPTVEVQSLGALPSKALQARPR